MGERESRQLDAAGGVQTIVAAESSFHRYFSLRFDEDKSNTQVETILIL